MDTCTCPRTETSVEDLHHEHGCPWSIAASILCGNYSQARHRLKNQRNQQEVAKTTLAVVRTLISWGILPIESIRRTELIFN